MSELRGRTALISGGGTGLGREMTGALQRAGVRVIACGRRPEPLRESGADRWELCDVADPESVEALRAELDEEQISILVNNAGIAGPTAPLVQVDPADWDEVMAINVRGTFLMCRAFLPPMIERRAGDVVNVASVSGKRPLLDRTPYCASKTAVIGITTTLAAEVGPYGIHVNTLSPGYVRSDRMDAVFARTAAKDGRTVSDVEAEFVGRTALHRMVEPAEVGQAVVAMLGIPGLTGADIDLSAGMIAR
ncbi:MAG TPA: SDR family oxidoreductase [Mycobacteriales bacterium]|nr:SDR family oxidoreductase [Mycobacteriales bacterium]